MRLPQNPYVGPRPFKRGERLFGRDEEAAALTDLMLSERIVLLYSPSGAGKSSLVEASVVRRLEADDDYPFHVLPTLRVSDHPVDELPDGANPYLLSMLLQLDEHLGSETRTPFEQLAGTRFKDHLATLEEKFSGGDTARFFDVLIFDQFEEILTLGVHDEQTARWRRQFFQELGQALKSPRRFALFSMREDFVAALDPFLKWIPTQLANTFRLELLTREKAAQAIARPAEAVKVSYDADALEHIVQNLSRVVAQGPNGLEEHRGLYVEPVQLQIVCTRLWQRLAETEALDDLRIEKHEVARVIGEVDGALASYYQEVVGDAAVESDVDERALRDWIAHTLIGANGIRAQVQQLPVSNRGDARKAVKALQNAFLVRSERRRGTDWYELAHDRLIRPIRGNNAEWSKKHLRPLQRLSQHWVASRDDRLLLRGPELDAELHWVRSNDAHLNDDDKKFLAASQKAAATARRRRLTNASVVAALAAAVLILGFQGYQERVRIAKQTLASTQEWAELVATVVDEKLVDAERFIAGEAAQDGLKELLRRQHSAGEVLTELQSYMEGLRSRARYLDFINTVLVTDSRALVLAAAPEQIMKPVISRSYPYREWFNGREDFQDSEEKTKLREPRREPGVTLAYRSTQKGNPMLVALAIPVWDSDGKNEVLGVLQSTIHVKTFSHWLEMVEDGECPVRPSLLLIRDQLIRHPCLADEDLPVDVYMDESSLRGLAEAGFEDKRHRGVDYFAATSPFETHPRWTALVLHDEASAMPELWLSVLPVLLLAGVTGFVGHLLFREHP